jgi:hypothetical protein
MTATVAPVQITAPGVFDIPDAAYHADPVPGGSLSSSGARKLLPPSCPALFRYERDNPPAPRREFDFGHAAHKLVLGEGPELVVVDADDWRAKAAKEQRDAAHDDGLVPLLRHEHQQVVAMADALRRHPMAAALFLPGSGNPEQSLAWIDQPTGIWRRARLDWLPNTGTSRLIVPDYKTCKSAAPDHLQRDIHNYGYHQQAAWYLDGIHALGLADDAAFVFVCQEKTPPYLVTVAQPDSVALRIGRHLNRQAIDIYRDCVATGHWPSYSDDVALISLPGWVENRYSNEEIW